MDSTHFLALKVMRLTRPTFVAEGPQPMFDSRDLLWQQQQDQQEQEQQQELSEMLSLPQNFGNIYLGETFAAYVSVHNDCNFLCRDIIVKADLQTNSSKVAMTSGSQQPVSELPPDRSIDEVLTHEVKELGPHILVCTVSYTSHSSEKLYFKKYFKFQVQRPLDVKTDFRTTECDEVFLEAKIQNITSAPIFLEKVFLEPSPHFELLDSPAPQRKLAGSGEARIPDCLRETEIRQFLYRLRPLTAEQQQQQQQQQQQVAGVGHAAPSVTVGKLDITWRSQMGQRARLQTSPLATTLAPSEDIKVTVELAPAQVQLNCLFNVVCRVTNNCPRAVQLQLSTNQAGDGRPCDSAAVGLLLCGKVSRCLQQLLPGGSLSLSLAVMPLLPGLQALSGVVLTDSLLKRSYEFDELAQVLVQP